MQDARFDFLDQHRCTAASAGPGPAQERRSEATQRLQDRVRFRIHGHVDYFASRITIPVSIFRPAFSFSAGRSDPGVAAGAGLIRSAGSIRSALQRKPDGTADFGFGNSPRTRKVLLAASTSLSTNTILASTLAALGRSGVSLAIMPTRIVPKCAAGTMTSTRSGLILATRNMGFSSILSPTVT